LPDCIALYSPNFTPDLATLGYDVLPASARLRYLRQLPLGTGVPISIPARTKTSNDPRHCLTRAIAAAVFASLLAAAITQAKARSCDDDTLQHKSADIHRISVRCEGRIGPSGVLSNGKSRVACSAGVKGRPA